MARVAIESFDERILVSTDAGPLIVDCSESDFVVATPDGATYEFGASTPGLARVRTLVESLNDGARLLIEERETLELALIGALRRVAQRRGWRVPVVERQLESLGRSPFYYAFPFLSAHHLREDVARFRPARIAVHQVDRELLVEVTEAGDFATRDATLAAVEQVFSWRHIYGEAGTSKKVLNKTLAQYGETASVDALWGLRSVRLTKLPETLEKLEILGRLGAHARAGDLVSHMTVVERATKAELDRALANPDLVDFSRGHVFEGFVQILSMLPVEDDWTFTRAARVAIERAIVALPPATRTALPPVSLPQVPGIRFLGTVDAIFDEGRCMQHCVASFTLEAVAGRAFIFHASTSLGEATVMLNESGELLQSFGPGNVRNETAAWAATILTEWGRAFVFPRLGLQSSTCARGAPPHIGAPLRTVGACFEVYRRMVGQRIDRDGALLHWFHTWITAALRGEVWLVSEDVLGMPVIHAIDRNSKTRSSSTSVQGRSVTVLPSAMPRRRPAKAR